MQLLAIVLYSIWGDRRTVPFVPGALNVVTGQSKTGKSALLDIAEFCLGRSTITMPVGPITQTVSWYAVLLQLPGGGRAFVARPAPRPGAASTQQAMLEVGSQIEPLAFDALKVNADAASIRTQLGILTGIEENLHVAEGSLRQPLEANLGHALFLCLQGQSEIASRNFLFHRQGESGIADAIRDTMPYFLGAVTAGQAAKRQLLEATRRDLKRYESELQAAERAAAEIDVGLRAAVAEAYTAGLINESTYPNRQAAVDALTTAVRRDTLSESPLDDLAVARNRELEQQRTELRTQLRELAEVRALLVDEGRYEGGYANSVNVATDRLTSIELIPAAENVDATHCPVCGSALSEPDPTVDQLRQALLSTRAQLADLEQTRPRRREALADLDIRITLVRDQLHAVERVTAESVASTRSSAQRTSAEQQAFIKGRLDVLLRGLASPNPRVMTQLRQRVAGAHAAIERLEAELDADNELEQVQSRLITIGGEMTQWAARLQLEHSGIGVRLDLPRLTIVADTESGPTPMSRIGSAENWIGYHLVAHLALHRYFVRQNRPVPRFLMLDQPTQAYYPSELEQRTGIPARDVDRVAVRRLYELMRDVVAELGGQFQIIVCDHANLDEEWFQNSVRANWREGDQLIPDDWIARYRAGDPASINRPMN